VGTKLSTVGRGVLVLGCVAVAGFAAPQVRAQGAPRPEPAPPSHRAPPRPDAAPGANTAKSSSASSSTASVQTSQRTPPPSTSSGATFVSSPHTTTYAPAVPTTRTVVPSQRSDTAAKRLDPKRQAAAPKAPATPTHRLGALASGGARLSAQSMTLVEPGRSASVSWLLLAVGLGLVVLVIGETTFLGLAESKIEVAEPPAPEPRQRAEDPPIRRVQLKH